MRYNRQLNLCFRPKAAERAEVAAIAFTQTHCPNMTTVRRPLLNARVLETSARSDDQSHATEASEQS